MPTDASRGRVAFAPLAAGCAALLLLIAASGWLLLVGRSLIPAQAAHLSVVVLPFVNLSGDPAQDHFADGITEGSVQRDENRVGVNAQLANALRYELDTTEATKAASVQNPDAIDLAMRGWAAMPPHSMPNKDDVDAARLFFE